MLPPARRAPTTDLDLRGLMARFWMRAVELHLPQPEVEAPQPAAASANAASLLPITDAAVVHDTAAQAPR